MQEEDDSYKKKSVSTTATTKVSEQPVLKAVKTQEGQRVPATQQKIPETKPSLKGKEESKKSEDPTFNAALEAIRLMKEKQAKSLV